MEVEHYNFSKLMTNMAELEIPYFQRGYVWKEENWERLWETLKNTYKSNFLGSIILKKIDDKIDKKTGKDYFLVIDGQQRLTTLSILVKVAYDYLSVTGSISEQEERGYRNAEYLLWVSKQKEESLIKHSRKDRDIYKKILLLKKPSLEDLKTQLETLKKLFLDKKKKGQKKEDILPLMLQCYEYFFNKMNNEYASNILTYLAVSSYNILVGIKLEKDDDDEQSIFETLNSAGAKLFISDIIKNNIFQTILNTYKKEAENIDSEASQVIDLYETYWEKKFESEKHGEKTRFWQQDQRPYNHLTRFLVAYAVIRKRFDLSKNRNNLPKEFAKFFNETGRFVAMRELLENIEKYSDLYYEFKSLGDKSQEVYQVESSLENVKKRLSLILNSLNINTFDAYILDLLYKNKYETLAIERDLGDLEKYIIITQIIGKSTKEYETDVKAFLGDNGILHTKLKELRKDIYGGVEASQKNEITEENKVLEGLKKLHSQKSIKLATQLLFWLELNELNKRGGVNQHIYAKLDGLQLEHILPQSWHQHWHIDGEELQFKREQSIPKIGNMTLLTAKINTHIKNFDFKTKMEGRKEGKTKISGIKDLGATSVLNKLHLIDPYNQGKTIWNEARIDERTLELAKLVLQFWDLPK